MNLDIEETHCPLGADSMRGVVEQVLCNTRIRLHSKLEQAPDPPRQSDNTMLIEFKSASVINNFLLGLAT